KGRPVIEKQKIRVEMLGDPITFTITSTSPSGTVMVTDETSIVLKEKPVGEETGTGTTYEDIGGLRKETAVIREMIELPLRHPELFQEIGIDPPKGILMHGPPGTGKTLLAKAVANESEASFFSIKGPEIITKYYGDSEANLREIFEQAEAEAPSIIFIDEIDSIAPKRGEMSGERQIERRVVSQLLTLLDGIKARGQVIVIAATNQPDILDEALRRGGRFDREIEIGVPDKEGRKEVLQIHTRGMPLEKKDETIDYLASKTHGFVGADLAALCKEAGMHALREIALKIDIDDDIPKDVLSNLKVTKANFDEAWKSIEPSAMREVCIDIPDVKWSDIGGLDDAKQELIETVEWPLKYPLLYDYAHTKTSKGILLTGPPGTGKTLLAKAVANESETNFISIKGPELVSKYVGESEKRLREIFKKAKQAAPTILFFDEMDSIAPKRGSRSGDSGTSERIISQLLTEMDGVEDLKDVLVLAATNRKDMMDTALLRPGRFDRIIEIGLPDKKTRQEILKIHCRGKPLANVDMAKLVEKTKGYSGADISALCMVASNLAIREFIQKTKSVQNDFKKFKITSKHFEKALTIVKKKREGKKQIVKIIADGQKLIAKMTEEDMKKAGVKQGDVVEAEIAKDLVRDQYEKEGL
ncbi:MAG: CDC48 family AAA ATPase, partial [Nanoarchaeota archaeon]|nr:CDC48 family AAA ATPase [Nanoarchaeota archaeon]